MPLSLPSLMKTSVRSLASCLIILLPHVALAEERHEDHEALRMLLKQSVEMLNSGTIEALRGLVTTDVLVTTAEQQRNGNFDDFKRYYDAQFNAPNATLSSISFQPVADEVTKFLDPNIGVVSGTSTDTYTFKNGEVRKMTSRWTSTLIKDGPQWKIAAIHFGVNFLDNPAIDAMRAFTMKVGALLGLGGIMLGGLLVKFLSRREKV